MKFKAIISIFPLTLALLTGCGGAKDSYGDACPLITAYSTEMAMIISSIPTAADMETRKVSLQKALESTGVNNLMTLKLNFNTSMNSALGLSGSSKPPTGSAYKTIEDLRTRVWQWDWASVSSVDDVNAIMDGFAAIDKACSN